jgi:hypothetical protein
MAATMPVLSDDKVSHLSHVILGSLKRTLAVRVKGDEALVLREIKRVLAAELAQEDELERVIRARLASYSRPIPEGSPEWEVLYRKAFEEESRRRKKA